MGYPSGKGGFPMIYVCDACGWEYDEAVGFPEGGIEPGTKWEDIPDNFECPLCYVGKDQFSAVED
jgi:rubredoxin-NAD+ reductase